MYTALLGGLLWAVPTLKAERFLTRPPVASVDSLTLIAHAGGGLPNGVYSNAREAFAAAYESGIRRFEVDLTLTGDGKAVLLHDWGDAWLRWHKHGLLNPLLAGFGLLKYARPDHADFMAARMADGLTPMDLDGLCQWADADPAVVLVMDMKDGPDRLLPVLAAAPDTCRTKMVPQVWTPAQYGTAKQMGFDRVALTVYKSELSDREIESFVREHDPYFLVMPAKRVSAETASRVTMFGDRLVVHTVNDPAEARNLAAIGVHGLITDSLIPGLRNKH